MVGLGYGVADEVGYYTISAGTSVGDASIIASYTANENGEKSYGAELGYSLSEIELGANYSFFNEKHSYGIGAGYQLAFGPMLTAGWSNTDGISAGLSLEF
jgi:predicted porin